MLQVTGALMGCVVRKAKLGLPLCMDRKETGDFQDNLVFQELEASRDSLEAKGTQVQLALRVHKETMGSQDLMDSQDVMDLLDCQVWLGGKVFLVTVAYLVVMELED